MGSLPFGLDPFTQITNVHWATKDRFTIGAGGGVLQGSSLENSFWCQFAGASGDGINWDFVDDHINMGMWHGYERSWFEATIRGKLSERDIILASGGRSADLPTESGPTGRVEQPFFAISQDHGKTFTDTYFPARNPGFWYNVSSGISTAVSKALPNSLGWNEALGTFYATVGYYALWQQQYIVEHWAYKFAWIKTQEIVLSTITAGATLPYPVGTKVVHGGGYYFPSDKHVVCSSNDPNVFMTRTDSAGTKHKVALGSDFASISVDGISRPVPAPMDTTYSVAAGNGGHIVIGGIDANSQNVIMQSPDWGANWHEILTKLKQGDQALHPIIALS